MVFVKMENTFAKIFNGNKLRNLEVKQHTFQKIEDYATVKSCQLNYKTHLTFEKVKN